MRPWRAAGLVAGCFALGLLAGWQQGGGSGLPLTGVSNEGELVVAGWGAAGIASLARSLVRRDWRIASREPETGVAEGLEIVCAGSRRSSSGDLMRGALCRLEAEDAIPESARPIAMFLDTTVIPGRQTDRYYTRRDFETWRIAFSRVGFEVFVPPQAENVRPQDVRSWSTELCMGLRNIDQVCLAPHMHARLALHQRINMINGMRSILWTKDAFCDTMKSALSGFSSGAPAFVFPCWIFPRDAAEIQAEMTLRTDAGAGVGSRWIVKPTSRGEGKGIFIAEKFEDLEGNQRQLTKDGCLVQPFMDNPLLIDGYKFDLRTYVLVTSISPLRVYIYDEGLVRFAAEKYNGSVSSKDGGKQAQFLTNTSVGKLYRDLSELTWTFERLRAYFVRVGVSHTAVFQKIYDVIVQTLAASEHRFHAHFRSRMRGSQCENCYQLLGVDVILNDRMEPVVIEVNGLPSMQLASSLDGKADLRHPDDYAARKLNMTYDLVALVFRPTPVALHVAGDLERLGVGVLPGAGCNATLHRMCVDKSDLVHLLRMRREILNRGAFHRIYPTSDEARFAGLLAHMHALAEETTGESGQDLHSTWRLHPLVSRLAALEENPRPR